MKNREKIIQLLENPLISGDGIEKMSNGRLYSANYQRYKKHVEKEKKPMVIFDTMSAKVEKLLLELAEEVLRVQPKTKQEYKEMVAKYSFRIERFKMVVRKKYDHWEIEITTWNKTNVVVMLLMLIVANWLEESWENIIILSAVIVKKNIN